MADGADPAAADGNEGDSGEVCLCVLAELSMGAGDAGTGEEFEVLSVQQRSWIWGDSSFLGSRIIFLC